MPNTPNYDFEYESPSSLPGTTLTGGPSGGSPILAPQVDSALVAIETKVDNNATNITANASDITDVQTSVETLDGWIQRGIESVSFTSADNDTTPVTFPTAFPGTPFVVCNIDSGAGETARWTQRAINVANTGFTIFVYASTGGDTVSWSNVPVSWVAIYRS